METRILSILTRTPLHVGSGASVGAIDLPIQRERHTQIPIIPGSSLKGVLRDLWPKDDPEQIRLFGPPSESKTLEAGELLVGEARVLLFPVRSAQGSFAWITSPLALGRFSRDTGKDPTSVTGLLEGVTDEQCRAGETVRIRSQNGEAVVLEEYCFRARSINALPDILNGLQSLDPLLGSLGQRLAVVSDGVFSHFCANACEVQQRVAIDDATHTVAKGKLFNQENVPSETVFYAVIGTRKDHEAYDALERKLADRGGTLQIGGDITVGLGLCSVAFAAA
ncbi:MAG: type III-B CRISPR module RAMP protein Cmr4 [Acidobacteriota bacterium]